MKNTLKVLGAGLIATMVSANAQIVGAPVNGAEKTEVFAPIQSSRLFSVPTANVIGNMDVIIEGGGFLGTGENSALTGNIGFGLGDVAQINISADELASTVTGHSKSVGVAAFKLRLLPEYRFLPAMAAIMNRSFQTRYDGGFSMIEVSMGAVASKSFFSENLSVNLGTKVAIAGYEPDSTFAKSEKNNCVTWHPMFGLRLRANPQTFVMVEFESAPVYNNDELTGSTLKLAEPEYSYMSSLGVRYYFTSWLSLDTGTRVEYANEQMDVTLKAKMNAAIPVRRLLRRVADNMGH